MEQINVMVVPVEAPPHLEQIDPILENLQALVGGFIEPVGHNTHHAYVNEEGLLRQLPFNPVASLVLHRDIVGPAVFVGAGGYLGEETSVPIPTVVAVQVAASRNALAEVQRDPIADAIQLLRAAGFQVIPPRPDAKARVRADAPDTSHLVEPKLGSAMSKVLTVIRGHQPITDDSIEDWLGLTHQSVSAARRTLVLRGLVYDSGERGTTRSGNKAILWKAVQR